MPPVAFTTAGRTNSEGIQCLYLAGDEETTFHEVRARNYDHVSVGKFVQTKELRIVDLSYYAIFNEKKFECTDVKVVQIGKIDYKWGPL